MKVKAQVLSVSTREGRSQKTGNDYSITEMRVIDSEDERPEVLVLSVHKNDVQSATTLQGKTLYIDTYYHNGRFQFGGQVVQAQKAA